MPTASRRDGAPPSDGERPRALSLGRYELLFRIASGGMAEVHAGRVRGEAGFEKLVAIKRMHAHLADDTHFVDMFLDEARVASNVSSPHVVQTLDLGRADDGSLFLVLELVVGLALSGLVKAADKRGETIPLPIALEVLAQSAQGLDDAHEATTPNGLHLGIVHRDVSPQNLLVGVDGRTRVTDFGIARALLRRTSTSTGELKGKISYFSPEQANAAEVDRRSDVFALGIVAWEAVTGRRLFSDGDALLTLRRLVQETIPNPRTVRRELPPSIAQVILRAVAKNPSDRWQTAAEMATALREAARDVGKAPTAREIGRWVTDVGGEKLASIRARIDVAMTSSSPRDLDDEAPTKLLASHEPSSGIVSRGTDGAISIDRISEPSKPSDANAISSPAPATSLPTAVVSLPATTRLEELEPAPARSGNIGKMAAIALGGLAVLGLGVWLGRSGSQEATSAALAPSATATEAPVTTEAASAAPAKSADAAPSATPTTTALPRGTKVAAPASTGDKSASRAQPTDVPPVAAAAPATKPTSPAPAATPTANTGPLLGDDAFNRDVSRKH